MVANRRHYWTAEEFLAFEANDEFKHELVNGEVYDMTGGTGEHSEIAANTIIAVGSQVAGSSCRVHTSDMMLKAAPGQYVYPDMSVVCGQPLYEDDSRLVLLNPLLVVEVTSATSATYDRGMKREFYQRMPSVRAYLIIDQHRVYAELYLRADIGWHYQVFDRLDAVIPLEFINCQLPLAQVYSGIDIREARAD